MRLVRFIAAGLAAIVFASCSTKTAVPSVPVQQFASDRQSGLSAFSAPGSRRVIYYYQTQYYNGIYISLAPIWERGNPATKKPYVTDLIVAAFHLGYDNNNQPYIHLNDNIPQDPMFDTMWKQVKTLQGKGVTVRMMLGGAAQGSYADLFSNWSVFYPILRKTIREYNLNGIDLDVEENVSLEDIEKLINYLGNDFGSKFVITLAPVATALDGGPNLSGFSYDDLYKSHAGAKIAYFDTQFYSGFGSLGSTTDYDDIVNHGYPPDKVVAGMIANPADGSGFVPIDTVEQTVQQLVAQYSSFGGVDAWEYFNAEPGGLAHPAKWAAVMAQAEGL